VNVVFENSLETNRRSKLTVSILRRAVERFHE
jgi:hypothetical protein